MIANLIKENDLIFLVLDDRKRWLIEAKADNSFHTHKGIIEFNDVIGKPYGSCVFSKPHVTQGYKFYALKPLLSDYVLYMARKTQIIYPEDAGLILMYTGIGPGSFVIEAGCGSGALTCILGSQVKPNGHVYSYDISEESLKKASKNVAKANLNDFVSIQFGNIVEDDLKLVNVDSIVLDLPSPWDAVEKVKDYLKLSGVLVSFSPTIEQVKKTTFALKNNAFIDVNTYELLKRKYQVQENATRPETRMIGHTGFMTFGRKVKEEINPYREKKPTKEEYVSLNGMPLRG